MRYINAFGGAQRPKKWQTKASEPFFGEKAPRKIPPPPIRGFSPRDLCVCPQFSGRAPPKSVLLLTGFLDSPGIFGFFPVLNTPVSSQVPLASFLPQRALVCSSLFGPRASRSNLILPFVFQDPFIKDPAFNEAPSFSQFSWSYGGHIREVPCMVVGYSRALFRRNKTKTSFQN